MEDTDEQQIQRDVDERREDQKIQRMAAVTDRLHNTDRVIVQDKAGRTEKINLKIQR